MKKKRTYDLSSDSIGKIEQLAKERNISYAAAIELMIKQYFEDRSEEHKLLKDTISTLFKEELSPITDDLNRIRVTSNVVDRNVQMAMEFWNHYFLVNDFKALGSTERFKTELFLEGEALIKNRIAHNRQRKLNWESKRKQKDNEE